MYIWPTWKNWKLEGLGQRQRKVIPKWIFKYGIRGCCGIQTDSEVKIQDFIYLCKFGSYFTSFHTSFLCPAINRIGIKSMESSCPAAMEVKSDQIGNIPSYIHAFSSSNGGYNPLRNYQINNRRSDKTSRKRLRGSGKRQLIEQKMKCIAFCASGWKCWKWSYAQYELHGNSF